MNKLGGAHLLLLIFVVFYICVSEDASVMASKMRMYGGIEDSPAVNRPEVEELGRFALQDHNRKQNAAIKFLRVVKAREQVVEGMMHYLTLEAIDAGKKKLYEAKIWVKPWMHFKEVTEFKPVSSANQDWQTVSTHDPIVQDAAKYAVKMIQQRSNSLAPYELVEVLLAKAQTTEDGVKYDILLKLKWGSKIEKYKVEVLKMLKGSFRLTQLQHQ